VTTADDPRIPRAVASAAAASSSASASAPPSALAAAAPVTLDDLVNARTRIAPYIAATPLRRYPALDEAIGHGVKVLVKHENHLPTNAFKARNAISLMTALTD
jgi:hypothetical protein